jgi:hypothetical protein
MRLRASRRLVLLGAPQPQAAIATGQLLRLNQDLVVCWFCHESLPNIFKIPCRKGAIISAVQATARVTARRRVSRGKRWVRILAITRDDSCGPAIALEAI